MNWKNYELRDWKKFEIADSIQFEKIKVLLLEIDWTASAPIQGRKNIIAIDHNDEVVWIADIPVDDTYATYHTIKIVDGELYGWSNSIMCKIAVDSGKILSERFVK